MSKLHGVDNDGKHIIISLVTDDFYETATEGVTLYSRHAKAWVVMTADTHQPLCFLDIPPDDTPIQLYRGRWLVVRCATEKMIIAGKAVDSIIPDEYIFDIETSRRMSGPTQRLCGLFINTIDGRAISLVSGGIITCGFLKTYDLLDYISLSGRMSTSLTSAITLGSSPASPGFMNASTHMYVMRKKGSTSEHVIYVGGSLSSNARLSPVLNFIGVYWAACEGLVAYNNKVTKIGGGDPVISFEDKLISHNLSLALVDVYFSSSDSLCLLYESKNFHAIITKKIPH